MLFIVFGRPVVVFGGRTLLAYMSDPFSRQKPGIKSKRIFLSADAALTLLIQPVRELPGGSFIVLCPVARSLSDRFLRKAIHSKKIC
jgi:hypothetical protein